VRECKKQLGFTLIGLGGIEESRLVEAAKLGFREVAVLGAIWQKSERGVETFRRLREQGDVIEEELYRMDN
jgi:thiamine monophosphate synthase